MTIKPNLEVLDSGTGSEGVRSFHEPSGARHSFAKSADPRRTSCVKCGRPERDSIHAYLDLGHRAAVRAHLDRAGLAASAGDFTEAAREARVAIRLAEED